MEVSFVVDESPFEFVKIREDVETSSYVFEQRNSHCFCKPRAVLLSTTLCHSTRNFFLFQELNRILRNSDPKKKKVTNKKIPGVLLAEKKMAPRRNRKAAPPAAKAVAQPTTPPAPHPAVPNVSSMPTLEATPEPVSFWLNGEEDLHDTIDLPSPPQFYEEEEHQKDPIEETSEKPMPAAYMVTSFQHPFSFINTLRESYPEQTLSKYLYSAPIDAVATPGFWAHVHSLSGSTYDTPKAVVQGAAAIGKVALEQSIPLMRTRRKRPISQERAVLEFLAPLGLAKRYKRLTHDTMYDCRPAKSKCKGFENPVHNQRHMYAISLFFSRVFTAANQVSTNKDLRVLDTFNVLTPISGEEKSD